MNPGRYRTPFADRLLVVSDSKQLADLLRQRYPHVEIAAVPTFMSGIAELANGPVHGIVACLDPSFGPFEKAVSGLRRAVGVGVPVVLCCDPESEPLARRAAAAGATDYLIYPPDPDDLDRLLSLQPSAAHVSRAEPATSVLEMQALGEALEAITDHPQRVLEGLAGLLIQALGAKSASVQADGVTTAVGEQPFEPTLVEPITRGQQQLGELAIGAPFAGAYTSAHVDKLKHYAGLFAHIIHAARQQYDLKRLALSDDLTGLPNRRYLLDFLARILVRASQERTRVTVCVFDIDDFKTYNDEFGHDAGDEILRAVAGLFQKHCRPEDVVARYGGDEFVVVFWDAESPRIAGSQHPSQAIAVMKRFQQALLEHEFESLGPRARGHLTISGGLANYPWDASTVEELLHKADQALLDAKQQGKNRFHLVGS